MGNIQLRYPPLGHLNQAAIHLAKYEQNVMNRLLGKTKRCRLQSYTFIISGVIEFGPREENEAMVGASASFIVSLFKMLALGNL